MQELTTWRHQTGDDARWAQPDFDDSTWDESTGPNRPSFISVGELGRQGGAEWFRTTVETPSWWAGQQLALQFRGISDAYEVYVEGEKIGAFGSFPPIGSTASDFDVAAFVSRNLSFAIPIHLTRSRTIHIAVRQWGLKVTNTFGFLNSTSAALGSSRNYIGLSATVHQQTAAEIDGSFHKAIPNISMWTLTLICGLVCFVLSPNRGKDREYFWLGLAMVFAGIYFYIGFPAALTYLLPKTSHIALLWGFGISASATFCYTMFLAEAAPPLRKYLRMVAVPVAICGSLWMLAAYQPSIMLALPLNEIRHFSSLPLVATGLTAAWLGARSGRWDTAAISIGVALRYLIIFATTINNNFNRATIGPFYFQLRILADAVIAVILVTILYFRMKRTKRRQQQVETDLMAARRVQEMLLGTATPEIAGFKVETAYRPAQEVGGDFYYFAPPASDGSLLAVVGDVSGKGLQAAMLVSSVIGSLRNEPSRSPGEILAHLNHSLNGRTGGGFVTAVVARFDSDGTVTVANAGHIAPFFGGCELELESGLPLGIVSGMSYPETAVKPQKPCSWTLVSDGVVEAANAKGDLFGFDRTRESSSQPAAEIANIAEAWGQNDDITVVTVLRLT